MNIKYAVVFAWLSFFAITTINSEYLISNFNKSFDVTFRLPQWRIARGKYKWFQLSQSFETGSTRTSRNGDNCKVDLLSLYTPCESAVGMLRGQCPESCATQILEQLPAASAPLADGFGRGQVKFCGEYGEWNLHFHNRVNFTIPTISGNLYATVHIPVRHRKFSNITWSDDTGCFLASDTLVRDLVTTQIAQILKEQGCYTIGDTKKTGIGDVVFELGWFHDFFRVRENLENVRLTLRAGVSVPSGSTRDEDMVFSVPLGEDGAWALPAALSIDLAFAHGLRFGLEFELLTILDETHERRVKTDRCQTDFLLLQKACTRKQYSPTWKFNVYGGFEHILNSGASLLVHYQYAKRDEDQLHVQNSNCFNHDVVSAAASIDQWSIHNFIFQFRYDFFEHLDGDTSKLAPQIMLFYKLPVGGRRAITAHTVGGQFSLNF